ncbi:MAG TPA: CoA-binding protein [Candidatus Polarisedimenticolia bacterium]|nr:CoA-binding protein [Candidatus Polarisedimenticolia bacterium]
MTERCEIPRANPTPEEIRDILQGARRIAVVGHSDDPGRDSHRVGRYLASQGYEVFAVNPNARSSPDLKFYPDLASVPGPIDIVDIFRRPGAIPAIVDEAIRLGAKTVWMQLGLADNAAAEKARAAGLRVVMSRCIMQDHRALEAR